MAYSYIRDKTQRDLKLMIVHVNRQPVCLYTFAMTHSQRRQFSVASSPTAIYQYSNRNIHLPN